MRAAISGRPGPRARASIARSAAATKSWPPAEPIDLKIAMRFSSHPRRGAPSAEGRGSIPSPCDFSGRRVGHLEARQFIDRHLEFGIDLDRLEIIVIGADDIAKTFLGQGAV